VRVQDVSQILTEVVMTIPWRRSGKRIIRQGGIVR